MRLAAGVALGLVLAAPAGAAGVTRHVGCVSEIVVKPGDRVLLKRGLTCTGTLTVRGSGAPGRRAVVGAYGRGAAPKIVATGADAVLLEDVSHVVLQDLDVTNAGPEGPRRGIHVVAREGVVSDVLVRRNHVHDVSGDLSKGRNGSGGIQIDAAGPPPVRFVRLRVASNVIERVSRSGISMVGTLDSARPSDGDRPWPNASTGVAFYGNRVDDIGGDGIVVRGTVGAVLEANVVSHGNRRGLALIPNLANAVCNAGIWTFHANGTVIRRNEVFGMESHDCDGTGFDIDYDQDRTVVEGNYSHDNEGGFILLCSDQVAHHRAEVRFNLSVDDGASLNTVPCRVADDGTVGSLSDIRVHNNTIVAPKPRLVAEQFDLPVMVGAGDLLFANNIVVATTPQSSALPCGEHCTHNMFSGLPASGADVVPGPPHFVDAARRGRDRFRVGRGFRLVPGSPGLGAGIVVAGDFRDFGPRAPTDLGF